MAKKFITLLVIACFCTSAFGQVGLLVKNIKTGKAWMYEKNASVTYILFQEQEYSTGVINGFLDSAVIFGKDTVQLKDIAGIRKKKPIHNIARIAGMPLMLLGSLLAGEGIASMFTEPESSAGIQAFVIGAGIFALGYLPYELNMEDLTVGFRGEWTLEIAMNDPRLSK